MQHLHSRGQGQGNGREGICPSPLDFGITYFSSALPPLLPRPLGFQYLNLYVLKHYDVFTLGSLLSVGFY